MKKILVALIVLLTIIPMKISADNYTQLWKKYETAERKDLPQDKLSVLKDIIVKASKEKSYGNLLKAETNAMNLKASISLDSIKPAIEALEEKAAKAEGALAAVYNCVLGDAYNNLGHDEFPDAEQKSKAYYDKALANPDILARTKAADYAEFVTKGPDSNIFNNDLLSIIGYKAGRYALLNEYYDKVGNRVAALVTALEAANKEWNETERYSFSNKMKGNGYIARLDSLINEYGDLAECGDAAKNKYEVMDGCSDVTVAQKVQFLTEARKKWGIWKNVRFFDDEYKELTNPVYEMSLPEDVLPLHEDTVTLKVRNLKNVTLAITRLDMQGSVTLDPNIKEEWAKLKQKLISSSKVETAMFFAPKTDYDFVEKQVALPKLKPGLYVAEISTNDKTIEVRRSLLVVSNIFVASMKLPEGKTRIAVLNATTGQPVNGATVETSTKYYYSENKNNIKSYTTEANGEVTIPQSTAEIKQMRAFTAEDNYMRWMSVWGGFSSYRNDNKYWRINIFTDRAVYRPGQTVHASAVAYLLEGLHNANVMAGSEMEFTLYDANNKKVETKAATTDDYGTATVDFNLPSGASLNGKFHIVCSYKGTNRGGVNKFFSVEEYKRPTFEVTIDEPAMEYHNGDTVQLKGHAKTYSGAPVSGARVQYNVKRSERHWFWFGYDGGNEDTQLLSDTVETDSNGDFLINVPVTMPEGYEEQSDNNDDVTPRWRSFILQYYDFTAKAQVTDVAGESHEAERTLTLGTRPTSLSFTLPQKALRDKATNVTFHRMNAAGKEIDGDVNYWMEDGNGRKETQVFTAKANTQLTIDWNRTLGLSSGSHTLCATCGTDTATQQIVLFSMNDTKPVVDTPDWAYLSAETFPADGTPAYLQLGTSCHDTHVLYSIIAGKQILESGTFELNNEVKTIPFTYKEEYGEGVLLNYLWVKDGKAYAHNYTIRRPLEDKTMKLTWKTFRDRLTPGQKESWTLNVQRPDFAADKINDRKREKADSGAQLLAFMYDKSLEQIVKNSFSFSLSFSQNTPSTKWNTPVLHSTSFRYSAPWNRSNYEYLAFSTFNYSFGELMYADLGSHFARYSICGNSAPRRLAKMNTMALAEPMMAEESVSENKSLASANQVKRVSLSDVENAADALNMDETSPSENGNSNGSSKETTMLQMRENLQETAFFYPALYADKNGDVKIEFTLPESVTTWNFCGFAHDKFMNYGAIQTEVVASKKVMVVPNMPRFVRVGDNATISSRIINTTENALTTKARVELLDPETEKVVFMQEQYVSVEANATATATFHWSPSANNPLLICRISAVGKDYSDGEQHYLPVLPSTERVITTAPFTFLDKGEKTISMEGLFPQTATDKKLTVEYTANPVWLMIQALPYMSNPDGKNAVSLVSAYYSNVLGRNIMQQSPVIKSVVELWNKEQSGTDNSLMSALERDQDLKTLVLSETPWVMDADNETEQKKQLIRFFDEKGINSRITEQVVALKALQNANGSFSWWQGMTGSPSMTGEVLETLARLNVLAGRQAETLPIIDKAMTYLGGVCVREYEEMQKKLKKGQKIYIWDSHAIQYLYINTLLGRQLPEKEKPVKDFLLDYLRKDRNRSIYAKALMAVILNADGKTDEAKEYIESIKQYSVCKPLMGRYFDTTHANYSWLDYRIPTQTVAIEAIKTVTPDDKSTINEMQLWLLQSKRTQAWDTPINSVNAVYAFLDGNFSKLETTAENRPAVTVAGKHITMSAPSIGIGSAKASVSSDNLGKGDVVIKKNDGGTSWGAVYAQYSDKMENLPTAASGLTVTRAVVTETPLGVGSKIKVRLTITADRDYDFVQVVDKRAACMEPVEQTSGYRYGYYQEQKDNATCYFFDRLAKGTHVVESEYYVDRQGSYTTGTVTAQCAYASEFSARDKSQTITVK